MGRTSWPGSSRPCSRSIGCHHDALIVANRSGGAGAEGFLYLKGKAGDPYAVIITLANLFTTPLATGVPFNWKELTPVTRLALDYFILWVNAETPYKTAKEYLDAVKKDPAKFKMGGTGTAQEDQIITVQMEQDFGMKFLRPLQGGRRSLRGDCREACRLHRQQPLRMCGALEGGESAAPGGDRFTAIDLPDWKKIPTMKEATGVDMNYLMIRGIFVRQGAERGTGLVRGPLPEGERDPRMEEVRRGQRPLPSFLTGADYVKWLEETDAATKKLMIEGKLIKK